MRDEDGYLVNTHPKRGSEKKITHPKREREKKLLSFFLKPKDSFLHSKKRYMH